MSSSLIDRDLGYDDVVSALSDMTGFVTLVGVHEEEGARAHPEAEGPGGPTLAQIAATNEFGSEDGRVPERSFLRATIDVNRPGYVREIELVAAQAVDGIQPLPKGIGLLGARVEGDVKAHMTDLRDPPNAPATIAAKGSSNPLIDTGRLRGAIRHEEEAV